VSIRPVHSIHSRRTQRLVPISLALGLLLGLLAAGVVLAQSGDLGGKVLTGSDVTVPSGTVDHDVYVFGGRVTSNATINGELVVAAGSVTVNGPVQGDVIVTGGQLTIGGAVGGHVRAAGGQVNVNGNVAKDVLAAGGQVTIGVTSTVGGDLIVEAGQLQLDGTVNGGATGTVGTYNKNGTIAGTDTIEINPSQAGPTPLVTPSNPVIDAIRHFVAVVLIGALLIWLWPRAFRAAATSVRERPLPAFGWGIVALIGYFVLLILIGIVGILLAIGLAALGFAALLGIDIFAMLLSWAGLSFAFAVASAFAVDAIVGVALAGAFLARGGPTWGTTTDRWADLVPLLVGGAVVVLLSSLPVIGWFVKLVVILLGLGAIVFVLWRPARPAPPVPPAIAPAGPGPAPTV
jgi:hypothetical protein